MCLDDSLHTLIRCLLCALGCGVQRMNETQLSHSGRSWCILSTIGVWEVPRGPYCRVREGREGEGGSSLLPPTHAHIANQLHLYLWCRLNFKWSHLKRRQAQDRRHPELQVLVIMESVPSSGVSPFLWGNYSGLSAPPVMTLKKPQNPLLDSNTASFGTREGSWPWGSFPRD